MVRQDRAAAGSASMIPKPPFACDLSLEDELAAFERLKPRLAEIWSALTASDDRSYTSVVVPSMTLDQSELRKLVGAPPPPPPLLSSWPPRERARSRGAPPRPPEPRSPSL